MKVIGVIPARYSSSRLKAKVLAKIQGKPMLQHVWERAREAKLLDELLIACDDEQILKAAQDFGAKAVLTSVEHPSGSDRIAEAVSSLDVDIVLNIQGDEPLIEASVLDALAESLLDDAQCPVATVIKELNSDEEFNDPNLVKVVIDQEGYALYFSRLPIPYQREKNATAVPAYKHFGLYAYRKDFLLMFTKLPKSQLEKSEQLEQLRVLEAGYKMKTLKTDVEMIGVDTPEDLSRVELLLR